MNMKHAILWAGSGLVIAVAAAGLMTTRGLAIDPSRYPDAVPVASEKDDFSLEQGLLGRQMTFETDDELGAVTDWYAELLEVPLASDGNGLTSGNCAWLTKARQSFLFNHSVSVMLCSAPIGTLIYVNENYHLSR
jgi:hypothetical protein